MFCITCDKEQYRTEKNGEKKHTFKAQSNLPNTKDDVIQSRVKNQNRIIFDI